MHVEIQLTGKPNHWTYQQRCIKIGRDSSCDISLPSAEYPMVSREHVVLEFIDGVLNLSDRKSENGTYLRGQRVSSAILHSGDAIRLGANGPELHIDISDRIDTAFAGKQTSTTAMDMATKVVSSYPGSQVAPGAAGSPTLVAAQETIVSRALSSMDSPTVVCGGLNSSADATRIAPPQSSIAPPSPQSRPHEIRIALGGDQDASSESEIPKSASIPKPESKIGDQLMIEEKLNSIRTLLKANLAVMVILILGLIYGNQEMERNRKAVVDLRTQAQSAVGQFQPELDSRLSSFDKRMDSMDKKMKAGEDQFVQRMNTEIPAMLDKYINRKMSEAQHKVPAMRP